MIDRAAFLCYPFKKAFKLRDISNATMALGVWFGITRHTNDSDSFCSNFALTNWLFAVRKLPSLYVIIDIVLIPTIFILFFHFPIHHSENKLKMGQFRPRSMGTHLDVVNMMPLSIIIIKLKYVKNFKVDNLWCFTISNITLKYSLRF